MDYRVTVSLHSKGGYIFWVGGLPEKLLDYSVLRKTSIIPLVSAQRDPNRTSFLGGADIRCVHKQWDRAQSKETMSKTFILSCVAVATVLQRKLIKGCNFHNRVLMLLYLFVYLLSSGQIFHTVWLEESEVQQGLEETHSFFCVTCLPQEMALL